MEWSLNKREEAVDGGGRFAESTMGENFTPAARFLSSCSFSALGLTSVVGITLFLEIR